MKNILVILCLFCLFSNYTFAQKELKVAFKHFKKADLEKADVYIDGRKYDHFVLDIINQDKIASVDVLKGSKETIEKYNAPNGVILVTTKMFKERLVSIDKNSVKIKEGKNPKFILNGKVSDKATITKLKPDEIQSIRIFKDEEALKKYNAPAGVIIITTK